MPTAGPPASVITYTHVTINEATEVEIDPKTNRITVLFSTNAGKIAFTGTDGAALTAADTFPVAADSPFTVALDGGEGRVQGLKLYTEVAIQPTEVKILSEPV